MGFFLIFFADLRVPCRNQIQHLGFELRYTLKVQHGPRKLDSVQKEFPFLGG